MEWLRKFLYGRYLKTDELSIAIITVMVILAIIGIVVKIPALYLIGDVVFLLYILRTYSRNIERRTRENEKFVKTFGPVYRKIGTGWGKVTNVIFGPGERGPYRYGRADEFSFALLVIVIVCGIANLLTRNTICRVLSYGSFAYYLFRYFSHNIERRERENQRFMKIFGPFIRKVKEIYKNTYNRIRDRKTHVYLKCPNCKQTLRLPKGRGKLKVTCPKCKTEFIKTT